MIGYDCSESLAQVGSKYLEVNFHRLGFINIGKILHGDVRKNKEAFLLFSSAAHTLWRLSILN